LPFKHNFQSHLGEMLRQRPGTRMAFALRGSGLAALAVFALLAPAAGSAGAAPLPDSVVVRMPHRDLTVSGVHAAWSRLEPRYRPAGEGTVRTRAFVDQLIEKEAMARAALSEPFTMSPTESAQFVAHRQNAERQELYRILIRDSVQVTAADRESAQAAAAAMATAPNAPPTPPEMIEREAQRRAEQRRAMEIDKAIRASLAPAWDDSVAALLARGYTAIGDTTLPDLANPFGAMLKERRPRVAAADTARVLVTSTAGTLTVADFARRFSLLNPFQSPLPTTAGTVKARGEQFLGQLWFDAEVKRRGIAQRPDVVQAVADRRESIALDHWYDRHVRSAIDTSETALRGHYAKDPARFGVGAHALIHHWEVPKRATADSLVAALEAGTPWDSVCARFAPTPNEKEPCAHAFTIRDDASDSSLVANLKALEPGGAYVRTEPAGDSYRVVQLIERKPLQIRPFEEVRTFVARDLAAVQSEDVLVARMAELVRAMPKTVNDAALAHIRLEP
jgi:hypothetical protein